MNVTMTARHCEISDALRGRVEDRAERLSRYEPRVIGVEVVFDNDSGQNRVESLARVAGTPPMVARAVGPSLRVALDRSMDKLTRQARRTRERHVDHQASRAPLP